jgi:hypothetical protein
MSTSLLYRRFGIGSNRFNNPAFIAPSGLSRAEQAQRGLGFEQLAHGSQRLAGAHNSCLAEATNAPPDQKTHL